MKRRWSAFIDSQGQGWIVGPESDCIIRGPMDPEIAENHARQLNATRDMEDRVYLERRSVERERRKSLRRQRWARLLGRKA